MIPSRPSRVFVSVALSLAVAGAATGCEILANFDRSKIPAEGGTEDAAAYDAQYPEAAEDSGAPGVDGGQDATVNDAGNDSTAPTDSPSDVTHAADSGDANVTDSNVGDTSAPDATDATAPEDSSTEDAASDDGG
jgi:hypothetical protein